MPEEFLSGRKRNIKVGLSGFNDTSTVLEVSGKVGIGTTIAKSDVHIVGDQLVSGVTTARVLVGNLTSQLGIITALHADNGYIQSGVVTTISGTTLSYNSGNFSGVNAQVGVVTYLSGIDLTYTSGYVGVLAGNGLSFLGISTIQTLQGGILSYSDIYSSTVRTGVGIVTNISGSTLNYTGVSTLSNAKIASLNVSGVSTIANAFISGILYDRNAESGNQNEVLISTGTGIDWVPIATVNNFNGITVKDEGTIVAIAGSVTTLNFIGVGVTAYDDGSGVGVAVSIATNPAGTDGQLQYNNGGYFGGAQVYYDDNANKLGINTSVISKTLEVKGNVGVSSDITADRVYVNQTIPLQITELTSKSYVDAFAQGIQVQKAVSIASTQNIGGAYDNGSSGAGAKIYGVGVGTTSIDQTALTLGERILIKNQTNAAHNGFYEVTRVGSGATGFELTRAPDYDATGEIETGDFAFVIGGVREAAKGFALITKDAYAIGVGTSALEFTQISSPTQKNAGLGLYDSGTDFNVGTANSTRIVINSDDIDLAVITGSYTTPGSPTNTFTSLVQVDSYGRVVGLSSQSHTEATTSVKGIASFDATNLEVNVGVVTVKQAQRIFDLSVSGISTINRLNVGTGGTVLTAYSQSGITSVGINTAFPAYTLDVGGVINSSTDVRVNGTSILFTANNDAVALAIALG